MYAPPCSWRTGTNWIEELASDSLRSSVSSPGIPNTYRTPSDSRHSTNTSDALRSLTCTILGIAASLALAAPASAASVFYIRGGGDGHGVGMSQYGAYGYALHGASYQTILGHYYQGTTLGSTSPNRIVRVLLGSGSAAFSGATKAGSTTLNAATTYSVQPLSGGSLALVDPSGRRAGTFSAPLTVSGPGPLAVAGLGRYRGSLEVRASAGGGETVDPLGLDDYVRG